jgi:hypothetical protein
LTAFLPPFSLACAVAAGVKERLHHLLKVGVFCRIGKFGHMLNPAGRCVFCGGAGLTKSHIWPEWLQRYLPNLPATHLQITGEFNTFEPKRKPQLAQRRVRQGHASTRKPRNTCLKCNRDWMRNIEESAMAPIIPLIQGAREQSALPSTMLNASGQRALAAFLCLITIRLEFTNPETQAATPSDREWLMEKLEPPPFWQIWIAEYTGRDPGEHWCRHSGLQLVSSPDEVMGSYKCDTQVTTLVIGKLCAHTFSSTTMPTFEGYEGARLCRIWPLSGWDIDCRYLPTINDRSVLSLAEALAREIPPVPLD